MRARKETKNSSIWGYGRKLWNQEVIQIEREDKMNTQKLIKSIIINYLQMHLTSINFLKSKSKKNKIDSKMFSQEKQRLESS